MLAGSGDGNKKAARDKGFEVLNRIQKAHGYKAKDGGNLSEAKPAASLTKVSVKIRQGEMVQQGRP